MRSTRVYVNKTDMYTLQNGDLKNSLPQEGGGGEILPHMQARRTCIHCKIVI